MLVDRGDWITCDQTYCVHGFRFQNNSELTLFTASEIQRKAGVKLLFITEEFIRAIKGKLTTFDRAVRPKTWKWLQFLTSSDYQSTTVH